MCLRRGWVVRQARGGVARTRGDDLVGRLERLEAAIGRIEEAVTKAVAGGPRSV